MPVFPITLPKIIKQVIGSIGKAVGKWHSYTSGVGVEVSTEFLRKKIWR